MSKMFKTPAFSNSAVDFGKSLALTYIACVILFGLHSFLELSLKHLHLQGLFNQSGGFCKGLTLFFSNKVHIWCK